MGGEAPQEAPEVEININPDTPEQSGTQQEENADTAAPEAPAENGGDDSGEVPATE